MHKGNLCQLQRPRLDIFINGEKLCFSANDKRRGEAMPYKGFFPGIIIACDITVRSLENLSFKAEGRLT